jgi:hypothetical protein
MLHYDT